MTARQAIDFTCAVPGAPRIAYEEAGRGRGVVFLHGVGGNRSNWRDQLSALQHAFHAVAWDARGYGDSEDGEGAWPFSSFADDLARLLDHLAWDRADVVGLSMGGRIAQDFYARYPGRVRSLTLCDTADATGAPMPPERRREFLRLRQEPLRAGKQPRDIAPDVADTLLGRGARPEHRQRLIDSLSALRSDAYLYTLEVLSAHTLDFDLRDIHVPTLLLYGEDDRLTPAALGERMRQSIPDARLVVIPEAGHLSNIERPHEFNAALLQFLNSLSAAAVQSGTAQ